MNHPSWHSRPRNWTPVFAGLTLLGLAGCGGDRSTDAPPPTDAPRLVTGVVSKGPLAGATVQLFAMDSAGNPAGDALAFTITASGGQFTIPAPLSTALLAVTRGGSYVDESDTDSSDGRRSIALGENGLRSVLAAGATTLIITPYTNALYRKAQRQAGGSNFLANYNAVAARSGAIFGFDVTAVLPADPLSPSGNSQQIQYAMLLGGAANAINAMALRAGSAPTFSHISAFIEDLADGQLAGADLNNEITRFRNNNFDDFSAVATPVVNEAAFAAPAPVSNPPPVAGDDTVNATEDTALAIPQATLLANDRDPDGGRLSVSSVSMPINGTVTLLSGVITFTPTPGFSGAASFVYTLSDGQGGTDDGTVTVTVAAVNDAPVAVDDRASTAEDAPVTISLSSLLANDTDPDGDTLTFGAAANAVNGAIEPAAGISSVIFSPAANFSGTASFDYTVSDGALTDTGTVSITVTPVNDPPTINSIGNPAAIPAGAPAQTVGLSGISAGGGETQVLSVTASSSNTALIPHPTVSYASPSADGSLSYTPVAGQSGTALITVTVSEDGGPAASGSSTSVSFTVTVSAPAATANTPPSVTLSFVSPPSVAINQGFIISAVTVSDSDAGANPVALTLGLPPPDAGTLAVDAGFVGTATGPGASVILTGSVANINAHFDSAANRGVTFTPAPGKPFSGPVTLSALVNDQGNTGSGGPRHSAIASVVLHFDRFELSSLGNFGLTLNGAAPGEQSGASVSGVGDLNGDGFDELAISANSSGTGRVYVVFGAISRGALDLSTLAHPTGFVVNGQAPGDGLFNVAGAGDFNGDGYDDLLIGAPAADVGVATDAGKAYLVLGRPNLGMSGAVSLFNAQFVLKGAAMNDEAGAAVSGTGDVNGDGFDDVIVGARRNGAGKAHVVFGGTVPPLGCDGPCFVNLATLNGRNGFTLNGVNAGDRAGHSVGRAGDIDGDGVDDIVLGAPAASGTGRAYLVYGKTGIGGGGVFNLSAITANTGTVFNGIVNGGAAGVSVDGIGDFNGDGFGDLVVGADGASPGGLTGAGQSYIIYGRTLGASFNLDAADVILNGAANQDYSGYRASAAGDVNGDGYDDVLIGALADPLGRTDAGAVYLIYGGPGLAGPLSLAALNGSNGFALNGAVASDQAGFGLRAAGDFDGDGFGDLAIGALNANPSGRSLAGQSYLVSGHDLRRQAAVVGGGRDARAPGEILVGSPYADLFNDGNFDDTVLLGGAGDDRFELHAGARAHRVNGGRDSDTVQVLDPVHFDLDGQNQVSHYRRYRGIEGINLGMGASIRISVRDVLRSSGDFNNVTVPQKPGGVNTLRVTGDNPGETVRSADAWLLDSAPNFGGTTPPFIRYRNGGARLDVEEDLNRFNIPVAFDWKPLSRNPDGTQFTPAGRNSREPVVSGDGRYAVFYSDAQVAGQPDPVGNNQVYRVDLNDGTIVMLSKSGLNAGNGLSVDPVISFDGRFVAFRTNAPNLVGTAPGPQVVLTDTRNPGSFHLVSDRCGDGCRFDHTGGRISISTDGRYVSFIGRRNSGDTTQVWRADLRLGLSDPVAVSVDGDGTKRCGTVANPTLCHSATMSGDGRWIAWTTGSDTAPGDTNGLADVYLRDMQTGELRVVSRNGNLNGNGLSAEPFISADGRRIAFESAASNLTPGDSNAAPDIFIYEIAGAGITRANTGKHGEAPGATDIGVNAAPDGVGAPVLSGDGRVLSYTARQEGLSSVAGGIFFTPYLKHLDGVAGGNRTGAIQRGHLKLRASRAEFFAGHSFATSLDFEGRALLMYSFANDVLPGDPNGADVFAAPNPLFVDGMAPDTTTDSDGDGLSNARELRIRTNPVLADTDGDGLNDGQEVNTHFTDPNNPDTDGDGLSDGDEVNVYGSDPLAPNANAGIGDAAMLEGNSGTRPLNFPVTATANPNVNLVVEYQTAPGGPTPATSGTDFTPAPANSVLRIPARASSGTIPVNVIGDTAFEPDESFLVRLTRIIAFPTVPAWDGAADMPVGAGPENLVTGDLDGDGKNDLVTANVTAQTFSALRNTTATAGASPSFAPAVNSAPVAPGIVGVALLDADADGKLDVAYSTKFRNPNDIVLIARNVTPGPGATLVFDTPVQLPAVGTPNFLVAADFDGDGKKDLATANQNNTNISVFLNTNTAQGTISFAAAQNFAAGNIRNLAVADFDGDGKLDIAGAILGTSVQVLRNLSSGIGNLGFATPFTVFSGSAFALVAADLDGDGKTDLGVDVSGPASVTLLRNLSAPGALDFGNLLSLPVAAGPYSTTTADFNGDGKLDLATASDQGFVTVHLNTSVAPGSFGFGSPDVLATPTNARSVVAPDLDGDGKPDLATAQAGAASVSVRQNSPGTPPAVLRNNEATGTILNDDPAPPPPI